MPSTRMITTCLLILGLTATGTGLAQDLTDPYEILARSFDAVGGLDRLRAEQSYYFEGDMTFAGMAGGLKQWSKRPHQTRAEITLGPLNIIQGDNGEHTWVLDQNGKLQVITNPDEATVKRRKVRALLGEYAYADRESDIFTVALSGIEPVEGKHCYVVTITNSINADSYTRYLNTENFFLDKAVYIEDDESRDVLYRDYREVDGLQVPFWTTDIMLSTGQASEIKLTAYESNPAIDLVLFEPLEEGAKDHRFIAGNSAENIAFQFIDNHLFVPAIVDGKERLWVLDTGAGMTVIRRTFADELHLAMEGDMKGQGAGGLVDVTFATLPPLRLAGIEIDEQTVAVIDMRELTRRLGLDVVGILGYDFLSRFVTKIDYANERVSFYDAESFAYSGDGKSVGIHMENSVFEVEATLDGSLTGSWLFDIGAGTTHLDGALARRDGYADRAGVLRMGHGAGNEYQSKTIKCKNLEFAGYSIDDPEISFHYGGTDTAFTADQIGILGNSLFRNFVLYCDYAHERLIVEKGAKFNQRWPEDRSGLQLAYTLEGDIEVTYVSPGTPADEAGFVKGDVIQSINGVDVDRLDGVIAIRKLLRDDPGTKCEFAVDRNGNGKTLTIELAELL